jgi:TPP-dependent indolepyruvate ferredoxin oxidoreductase alpha subunit
MPQSVWLARTIAADGSCDESNCNSDNSCASVARCPSRFVDEHSEEIRRECHDPRR